MRKHNKHISPSIRLRFKIFHTSLLLIFLIIAIRSVLIHLFPSSSKSLDNIADKQYQKRFQISPYRGSIFDRRGHALAISIKKSSIFINPRLFSPNKNQTRALCQILGVCSDEIDQLKKKRSYFWWLKRKIPQEKANKILALKIKGLNSINEAARFYPFGKTASHLIGVSGIDDSGLMGLEKQYDPFLKGQKNEISRARDAKGNPIFLDSSLATPAESGHDVHLTIDLAIQEIARKELEKGILDAGAKRGFALVQDPHTGQILALSALPSYNPNKINSISNNNRRSIPLVDPFEPGSVLKPLLVAEALDKGLLSLDHQIDCEESGVYSEDRWRIRDSHANGTLSVKDILVKSSNIGTYKISNILGRKSMYEMYKRYGLMSKEQLVGYPGQRIGTIPNLTNWTDQRQATISFGQGIMTTALEISTVYGAFANGGKLLKPILTSHLRSAKGGILLDHGTQVVRQIFSPQTAKEITTALVEVVENGTATKARIDLYTVAGKTGTSEKIDPKTKAYSDHLRGASFIGYTPAWDPHLVIYVMIDEPSRKPYYGGTWAAPVFKEIALKTLKYLNVPPDKSPRTNINVSKGILAPRDRRESL